MCQIMDLVFMLKVKETLKRFLTQHGYDKIWFDVEVEENTILSLVSWLSQCMLMLLDIEISHRRCSLTSSVYRWETCNPETLNVLPRLNRKSLTKGRHIWSTGRLSHLLHAHVISFSVGESGSFFPLVD